MRYLRVLPVFAVLAVYPALALAHRAPTRSQKAALNTAFNKYVHATVPAHCLRYEVSTANSAWADVEFDGVQKGKLIPSCAKFASNGEVIFHLTRGRWRFVTAGSSFVNSNGTCGARGVPTSVVKDFKLCG
jgi:hypothetical protein